MTNKQKTIIGIMNTSSFVVGIGEVLWDVFPGGKQLGGAPANFVYHVTRFGCQGLLVSAVGKNDAYGNEICAALEERKIRSVIEKSDYPTGRVQVSLDKFGIPEYDIVKDVAWDNIVFTEELESIAQKTVAVCFGSLAQRNPVSRKTIMKFVDAVPDTPATYKIFDINLRQNFYDKEILEYSMKRCNILKINEEELLKLRDLFYDKSMPDYEVCNKLKQDFSLKYLILTRGAENSFVYADDKIIFRDTPKVDVVDTVGAGDSFTAAFVASLLNGADAETAHTVAVETSAYVCTQKGAMPEMPVR